MKQALEYSRMTDKAFQETVDAVVSAAGAAGFRTLHIHEVDKTLAEKGFRISKYSIVEVCNAGFAYGMITKYKPVGMMLPCRIVVYEDDGGTVVMLMKPVVIAAMMPDQDFGNVPEEVEKLLVGVVDEAVK